MFYRSINNPTLPKNRLVNKKFNDIIGIHSNAEMKMKMFYALKLSIHFV